ncbi:MAG: hypothetical protein AAGD23_13265, partial [Pseudomonadota bacterium]
MKGQQGFAPCVRMSMCEIVSRSLQFFAQPAEVSAFVSQTVDQKLVDAVFFDGEDWTRCEADQIEKDLYTRGGRNFFYLFSELQQDFERSKEIVINEGCWVRLQAPSVVEDKLLMAVLDTKGPPDRARLFGRIAREFKKTLLSPTYGFS